MSLNTSMPYYRNTSRETKTVREILQHEGIKSARLTSRDKKQNTSITDSVNRSKRKANCSFYDNRSTSQIENSVLHSYIANAFQERKENQQQQQQRGKYDEQKQKEMKYLMRIGNLEKESQKLTDMVCKLKKENQQLKQHEELSVQLQEQVAIQKSENAALRKYLAQMQSQSKKSEQKSTRMNTQSSKMETVPSYMLALSLVD